MQRIVAALLFLYCFLPAVLPAQRAAAPSQRYFRLICLVHLKGTGQSGDAIVPEYVVEGTAVAQMAASAAMASSAAGAGQQSEPLAPKAIAAAPLPGKPAASPAASMASRPGILGWRMLTTDDGTMAIIQVVAADRHAFDSIFADTRPEIRIFEIGKDKPEAIQTELRKYKKDFDLASFRVVVR